MAIGCGAIMIVVSTRIASEILHFMEINTRIQELRKLIEHRNHQYYVLNSSPATDAEYDTLYNELSGLEKKYPQFADSHSPTQRIGAESKTGFKKVKHADMRMLSLDNMRSAADVIAYLGMEEVMLEPKIDGASMKVVYKKGKLVQAITRGNGMEGDNVTANARAIMSVPLALSAPIDITVVGEVFMTYSAFNDLNQQLENEGIELMANPRNSAAGALKLKNPKEVAARSLSYVVYGSTTELPGITTQEALTEQLEILGFLTVSMLPTDRSCQSVADKFLIESEAMLFQKIMEADTTRKFLDLPTDGLVFKLNSLDKQRELGEGTKYPNYACAYKFQPERKETMLLGVTVQIGRTGKLTPVAELEPVSLGGTLVRRASLCNQEEINRLNINVGDSVLVEKSAEIIPKVMGVGKKASEGVYRLPLTCPCCQTPLEQPEGFVDTFCPNKDCNDQVLARLKHGTGKAALDIDGCGETLLQELMKHGVRQLSDLLTINPGFLKASARKRFETGRALAAGQPLWRKFHALGIEGVGQTLCQEIASQWNSLEEATNDDNMAAFKELLGDVAFNSFCVFMATDASEFAALDKLIGLEAKEQSSGPLKGKSFCVTGDLISGSRNEVSRRIEDAGGVVKSSVSRRLNYLIQGTETGRVKREAAERHGIPIITETQLYVMLGQEMPLPKDMEDKEY